MADILTKLTERRAELLRQSDEHHRAILAITRDARVTNAALAEIEFAIAACADCAVSGEAGAQGEAPRVPSGAPGAESASAGEFGGQSLGAATDERLTGISPALGNRENAANVSESPSTKKPRVPKRSSMVLEFVTAQANRGFDSTQHTVEQIAEALGIRTLTVKKAVAYWQAQERVTLAGGVVLLRTKQPDPVELNDYGRPLPESEAQQSEAAE